MIWGNVYESEKRLMYNCEKYYDIINYYYCDYYVIMVIIMIFMVL